MCGIIGLVSKDLFSVKNDLLKLLKKLEYRGYDSAGFATIEGVIDKQTGGISGFIDTVDENIRTNIAISHTRWATHGGVTKTNAHPHFNKDRSIICVHNGIVENFQELKTKLEKQGYKFMTETDTEIIPHYFDQKLKAGKTIEQAIPDFFKDIKGTFAVLLFEKDSDKLYCLKRDSPLVLGPCKERFIVSSDIYGFDSQTNKAIFFEDNEFCMISKEKYQFYDSTGKPIDKKTIILESVQEEQSLEKYDHYRIKEIMEQPFAAKRLINSCGTIQKDKIQSLADEIRKSSRVVFVASGTSYHASLLGVFMLNQLGIKAHTVIASEFENYLLVDKDT